MGVFLLNTFLEHHGKENFRLSFVAHSSLLALLVGISYSCSQEKKKPHMCKYVARASAWPVAYQSRSEPWSRCMTYFSFVNIVRTLLRESSESWEGNMKGCTVMGSGLHLSALAVIYAWGERLMCCGVTLSHRLCILNINCYAEIECVISAVENQTSSLRNYFTDLFEPVYNLDTQIS